MCWAIRKIFRSYRVTNWLNASRSPPLAACTSASSSVIPSSAFFWMVAMQLRLKIIYYVLTVEKGERNKKLSGPVTLKGSHASFIHYEKQLGPSQCPIQCCLARCSIRCPVQFTGSCRWMPENQGSRPADQR